MTGRLLTVAETARQLRCSPRTVRRLLDRRELPVCRVGRLVRIDERAVAGYIAARTRPAAVAAPAARVPAMRTPASRLPPAKRLWDLPDPLPSP